MNEKKIKLAILKELEKGNRNMSNNDFELNEDEFIRISKWLEGQGLISGVGYYYDSTVDFTDASITLDGEKYLSDNSNSMKFYKSLKEIRDWLK